MGNGDHRKANKEHNLNHPACWNQMLTKAKKQESDKLACFTILEYSGMLKPNTCNFYTWTNCNVWQLQVAKFNIPWYSRMVKLAGLFLAFVSIWFQRVGWFELDSFSAISIPHALV